MSVASSMDVYDVCIVGAGMTGSAAARWVSERPGTKACLIGPSEPTTEEEWSDGNRAAFGSHYDEARIVSEMCSRRRGGAWPVVVRRSIDRFRHLERESGIRFYHEVGCVFKSFNKDISKFHNALPPETARSIERLAARELSDTFPFLQSDDEDFHSLYEPKNAGYINPRKYILANVKIAERNGCEIIDDEVSEITECGASDSGKGGNRSTTMKLVTKSKRRNGGDVIIARRVLLCVGGFVNFQRLLPEPRKEVDIDVVTEMAVMIELSEEDALRMSAMPAVLVYVADDNDPRNAYILPPVRYPDGKMYLKVGHDNDIHRPLRSHPEVMSWYREKGKGHFEEFKSIYLRIYQSVTGFRPKSLHSSTCVTTVTPTGQFYCDMVTPTLGLVTGGNGGGAMAADEIGRMGARLIVDGTWNGAGLPQACAPREEFRVRWRDKRTAAKSSL